MANDMDDILSPATDDEHDEFGGLDGDFGKGLESMPTNPPKPTPEEIDSQMAPTPSESPVGAPVVVRRAKKAGSIKKGKKGNKKRKTMSLVQKSIRLVLRRSGKDKFPHLDELMRGKNGKKIAINEIGIFSGTPRDKLISELATDCMIGNTLNFSAEITKLRTLQVGTQIIKAGRMHSPIHLAQIQENGSIQCVSGRHRLVFLILAYGADAKIPVYIENMTLEEARDAMGVANDSRPAKAKERAELAVLKALKGKSNVNQDELYAQMATSKSNARKYCIYSVTERGYPVRLGFKVSATSSRKDGGITTLSSVETFLNVAMDWSPEMKRQEFDDIVKGCILFVNALEVAFKKNSGFNPDHHMTTNPMTAIGKYYYENTFSLKINPICFVEEIANKIISMGDLSRKSVDAIYDDLML